MRTIALPWLVPLLALAVSCQTQPAAPATAAAPAPAPVVPDAPVPEDALNLHTLAKAAFAAGEFERAAELYASLGAKYHRVYPPAGADAHIILGDCLMQLKRYDLAVAAYENAVVGYLNAGRPYLLYLKLGDAYVTIGKFAQAYQVYMLGKLVYGDDAKQAGVEDRLTKAREAFFAQLDAQRKQQEEQQKLEQEKALAPPAPTPGK